MFEHSHVNVESKNFFFQKPEVGDVVKVFGKFEAVVVSKAWFHDGKGEQVFEVARVDKPWSAMPFESEMKVVWKRNDNFNQACVAEMNARNVAQQSFEQFSQMNW